MTFEVFGQNRTGRKGLGENISLAETQIYFGKNKPPYESLVIEYDKDNCRIRFSAGSEGNSHKVKKHSSGYFINAYAFMKRGLLPKGRYRPIGDNTYELIG